MFLRPVLLASALLTASAFAGGGSSVDLHKVEVDPMTATVTVEYSKDFATCAHMKDTSGALVHTNNVFCTSGNHVVVVLPLSEFKSNFAVGAQVDLCHGNNGGICSPFVTVTSAATCQADLGFGGPGNVHISVCGSPLATGQTATFTVASNLPSAAGFLFISLTSAPTFVPPLGGTILPLPILVTVPLATDGTGSLVVPGVPGGSGPVAVFVQTVFADGAQPKGFAVSNALRIDFLP